MNNRIFKKILSIALATTLLVAPVLTAGATTDTSEPARQEEFDPFKEAVSASGPIRLGSTIFKPDIAGKIMITKGTKLTGMAVRNSAATISSNAGLTKTERPYFTAYTLTPKTSGAVYDSFNGAAAAVGGRVLGGFNANLSKIEAGKRTNLSEDVKTPLTVGVENKEGLTLEVAKVVSGGETTILEDQDTDPNTVTFDVSGGDAAYAVIGY